MSRNERAAVVDSSLHYRKDHDRAQAGMRVCITLAVRLDHARFDAPWAFPSAAAPMIDRCCARLQ